MSLDKPFNPATGATTGELGELTKRALGGKKAALCCREGFAADVAEVGETISEFASGFRQVADNHINFLKEQIGQSAVKAAPVRIGSAGQQALLAAAFRLILPKFAPGGQNITPYWFEESGSMFVEFGSLAEWEQKSPQALQAALGQSRLRSRTRCEECVRKALWSQGHPQRVTRSKRRSRLPGAQKKTRPRSTSDVISEILGEKFDPTKETVKPTTKKGSPGADPERP